MSEAEALRPFWVRPPTSILFDLVKLQELYPWEIHLREILEGILGEIRRAGYVEFGASGVALLSSAIIFRRKTELLLELQEPPRPLEPGPERAERVLPPLISLPVRSPHAKIGLSDLAQALAEAIELMLQESRLREMGEVAPPLLEQMDDFMVNLELHIEELRRRLSEMLLRQGVALFTGLVEGMTLLEAVRTFLILLFLAMSGEVDMRQAEDGDIWIGGPEAGRRG